LGKIFWALGGLWGGKVGGLLTLIPIIGKFFFKELEDLLPLKFGRVTISKGRHFLRKPGSPTFWGSVPLKKGLNQGGVSPKL